MKQSKGVAERLHLVRYCESSRIAERKNSSCACRYEAQLICYTYCFNINEVLIKSKLSGILFFLSSVGFSMSYLRRSSVFFLGNSLTVNLP